MENKKEISELRQDPVSRDWIIISTGRAKRLDSFKTSENLHEETPIGLCSFEDPKAHGNEVVKIYSSGVKVVNNKFPIIKGEVFNSEKRYGPYLIKDSAGYHEVVIFKDHKKSFAEMSNDDVFNVVSVYHDRYNILKNKECANYILIIHNHGYDAGASVSHPHSQILAIPFIPSDISRSLSGSAMYKMERKRCVHCDIIEWELKEKKRIIFENDNFVALIPYVPRFSYEIRIFPKNHQVFFEEANNLELKDFAEALKVSLAKIFYGLGNPSYNFFIHTPPTDVEHDYSFYHWHLEINPRIAIWGGFELGTGGEVINTDPDEAAEYLRNIKV